MHRLSIAAIVAGVSTIALTQIASAADQPTVYKAPLYKAPPPPAPVYNWTGFYAGLNAGYGWGTSNNATTTSTPLEDGVAQFFASGSGGGRSSQLIPGTTALANSGIAKVNQKGFIGGGQIGYNSQWGANVVLGIEADIQGADIRGAGSNFGRSTTFAAQEFTFSKAAISPNSAEALMAAWGNPVLTRTAVGVDQVSADVKWMGTVRGRVGYLITPNFLIYATGGLAYGGVRASPDNALQINYNFTADSFALAYAQANGPSPVAIVSATAGPNSANASVIGNTLNIQTATTVAATVNSAAASVSLSPSGSASALATCPGCSAAALSLGKAPAEAVINYTFATKAPPKVAITTHSQSAAGFSDTRAGGSIGGGFEWLLSPDWSFKAEGLYYDLGRVTLASAPLTSSVALVPAAGLPTFGNGNINSAISKFAGNATVSNVPVTRVRFDGVVLRGGINYHFNWGG
jgi:opacity protein-like surface antigen